jgi:CRISPR-associated protein Cas5d
MRWVVTRILVLKPIRFQSMRRVELQSRIAPATVSKWMEDPRLFRPVVSGTRGIGDGTLRNTLALRDVSYVIEAYPLVYRRTAEDTPVKYAAMFNRRVRKGKSFQRPSLGLREFPASFELAEDGITPIESSCPLGRMLYDIVFREDGCDNRAIFFEAALLRGCLDTHPLRAIPDAKIRKELLACSYSH